MHVMNFPLEIFGYSRKHYCVATVDSCARTRTAEEPLQHWQKEDLVCSRGTLRKKRG